MHNKLINIIRIFFVLILVTLGVLVFLRPANTETNILKAVFSSTEDNILVELSSKFSARLNVIVENESPEKSEEIAKTIYAKLDKNAFYTSDVNIAGVLSDYEKHHNNLLSAQMRRLLINKQYDVVEEKGLEALYNPIMPPIGSIEEDPFLLLTDFVMELSDNKEVSNFTPIEFNEKYYSLIMLNVDSEIALSPSVLNEEVEKLTSIQKEFSKDGTNVYLSGAPVHSYFASSHSIFEIVNLSEKAKNNTSVDNTSVCKSCEIKYICGGGCRIKYDGIKNYDTHKGEWHYRCNEKNNLLDKMILCNEYFFEE